MEKILVAIDGMDLNINSIEFACYLARLTNSKLTGAFLENMEFEEKPTVKQLAGKPYIESILTSDFPENEIKRKKIEINIRLFKNACENRSVSYNIHRDRSIPVNEMIAESRFADLIVIDAETSFEKRFEGTPTRFVKDVLKDAECPIIISPESFRKLDEIIFAYDGSKSSMFAIKQFTYLFPWLKNEKIIIVEANKNHEDIIVKKHEINEWVTTHYSNVEFKILQGDSENELFGFLLKRKNSFLVIGAYGRNMVSLFFKHSHADILVRTLNQPIFISHF